MILGHAWLFNDKRLELLEVKQIRLENENLQTQMLFPFAFFQAGLSTNKQWKMEGLLTIVLLLTNDQNYWKLI